MRTNEELVKEIQEGRREEMPVLWEQVYRFVCLQAHRWKRAWENRPGFEVDDLTQSGYIALCKAVQEYRPEKSMSFINYFSFFLKREFKKVSGCSCKRQLNEPLNNAVSLDAPASNDTEELSLGDTIEAEEPGFEAVENALTNAYTAQVIREALRSLPELERFAIEERYFDDKTFVEIGEEVGRNFSTVRHYTKQGLKKLRKGRFGPTLSELLWGDRNFYRHTGFTAWKESGCSVQEWLLFNKEKEIRRRRLSEDPKDKIWYCVNVLGMDRVHAERIYYT